VALDGRASCRFAPVICSLGQPHTRAAQARTSQSAACLGPGCQRGAFREACCQAHLLGNPHEALCRVATACDRWPGHDAIRHKNLPSSPGFRLL